MTLTGTPSVRIDRSPRIICSVPSNGVQGASPLGAARSRDAAIGDLDPLAVADPRFHLDPFRVAVLVHPAERLLADVQDGLSPRCMIADTGRARTPGRSMVTLA